jgi:CubicO group peptidase (beta-lactamase class C family)
VAEGIGNCGRVLRNASTGLSEKELISELRAKLEQETAEDSFSGAVLIARNGAPIFAEAYGLADREQATRNTVQTRFRLGSINKMFTGVATLQLVEAGKLRLDDPLGKYLTDFPQKEVATKVTVEHLPDHSTHYGYGFEHHTTNGVHWIGHTGGAIGMNGDLEFSPELGYTVVSLANLDPPSAGRIARFIITSLSIK